MPEKTATEWSDTDPSFIRTNASELFNFARRLGMSSDQVRDAVDSGLIKPAATARLRLDKGAAPDIDLDAAERPDAGL
ncbi:hypothetical protein [Ramlibacter albus]|uniref:Uncharacterized protein n=1 Tax=Ramlibacter albus TaxID=2079448 RepID=A0A923MB73_9BURK|nr:hypothetical protein [Ramlibacter albus]MBC5765857.1 hypothetical protein [Ramlibacter albus]